MGVEVEVDHYGILGLPTGEDGAKLSLKEITKAYRWKALELHPDKRLGDPNAQENFQKLQHSYEVLKDAKARKLYDDLLRVKCEKLKRQLELERERLLRQAQQGTKRRKMIDDLEERERAYFASESDPSSKAQDEEERISRQLKEEIARIRAMHANVSVSAASSLKKETTTGGKGYLDSVLGGLEKEKFLKVSWEKVGEDYSAKRLRELFEKYGVVEDVVIKTSKKRGSALIVMASKDAAIAAAGDVCGGLSNPLLVLPLQPAVAAPFQSSPRPAEPDGPNLVGAGYQAFEDSVLNKLQKITGC